LGLPETIIQALETLGTIYLQDSHLEEAEEYLAKAYKMALETGNKHTIAWANYWIGFLALEQGNYEKAMQYEKAAFDADYRPLEAWSLIPMSFIASIQGSLVEGKDYAQQVLQKAISYRFPAMQVGASHVAGLILSAEGQLERAVEVLALTQHHRAYIHYWRSKVEQELAKLENRLTPEVFAAAVERGKALDLDATVQELLEEFRQEDGG